MFRVAKETESTEEHFTGTEQLKDQRIIRSLLLSRFENQQSWCVQSQANFSVIYLLAHRHEKSIILKLNHTKSTRIDHIYGVFPVTLEAGHGHTHHTPKHDKTN